jgi:3-hydroxyisobutyrate dehydrogenase-like beta-hydroxyacid dehydrogenase
MMSGQTDRVICDLALIGFGEAGSTFARAGNWGLRARAYDVASSRAAAMAEAGIMACTTADQAIAGVPLVLSLVTADAALAAAESCASLLPNGTIWCDMNSVAPQTKLAAARAIESAGGHYVDAAVLAPVHPARLGVPLLLSGPSAGKARILLAGLGFTDLRVVGAEIGRASAIKMVRSVMVKGVEALTAEMMLAAEAAGVADEVLASLDASERPVPWTEKAAYNIERMTTHGLRRAAEMEEVAKTLVALGVAPVMTDGTIRRQRDMAGKAPEESKKSGQRNAA